jgi:hypothetical protein
MSPQQSLAIDRRCAVRGKCRSLFEWMVRKLDSAMKSYLHIFEYTGEQECILRIAFAKNDHEISLSDGTHIPAGETIGELHFWNEHIPPMTAAGPDLTWALNFQRRLIRSLAELAEYVDKNPEFSDVRAFRGELFFGSRCKVLQMSKSVKRCGFEIISKAGWSGLLSFFSCFWEIVYNMMLVWAFNPASLKDKKLRELKRCQLWMSRRVLLDKYLGEKRHESHKTAISSRSAGNADGKKRR